MIQLHNIRHAWPETAGFAVERPVGHAHYTFLHFAESVDIYIDGVRNTAPPHACILYRPHTPQYFVFPSPMTHDWFHFTNAPEALFEELNIPLDTIFVPKQWYYITGLVLEMERESFSQKTQYEQLVDLKFRELLIKLSRSIQDRDFLNVPKDPPIQLKALRQNVMSHLTHPWTVAKMAASLAICESKFHNLYRAFFGISPIDDLIHARIEAAQNLLLSTDRTVYDISEATGFNNVTHFCRQFRKLTGTSPTEYRKRPPK